MNDGWIKIYRCKCCDKEIRDNHIRFEKVNDVYCPECAYKLNFINSEQYIKANPWLGGFFKASINPNTLEIEIVMLNSKFSWEKTNKDYRQSPQYKCWRLSVFERDNYTCQKCSQKGGKLEAHHIKTFKLYKNLRFVISNGMALCVKCHKQTHKEMKKCQT